MWESTKLAVAELTGSSYLTCLGNVASREQNSFHRTHGGQTGRPWAAGACSPSPRDRAKAGRSSRGLPSLATPAFPGSEYLGPQSYLASHLPD